MFRELNEAWLLMLGIAIATGAAGPACHHVAPTPASPSYWESTVATASSPRLDPQMKAVLDELVELGAKPIETLSPREARRQPTPADAVRSLLQERGLSTTPEPVARVQRRTIRSHAADIPVRVYTPAGSGPFPVVVYFHGGGWTVGRIADYDATARALANGAGAVVVAPAYRQAPEHRFPSAHDDAIASYRWALEHAPELDGDRARIAVAGEGSGANLAAFVPRMAHGQELPPPVHQLLVYPIAGHDVDTPSYRQHADARPLARATMTWFFASYLGTPADADDARISLMRGDHRGLPPATVITAEIDPLRSEGEAYAKAMKEAGVDVAHRTYAGVTHEFFGMGAVVGTARAAQEMAAARLRRAFAAPGRAQGASLE